MIFAQALLSFLVIFYCPRPDPRLKSLLSFDSLNRKGWKGVWIDEISPRSLQTQVSNAITPTRYTSAEERLGPFWSPRVSSSPPDTSVVRDSTSLVRVLRRRTGRTKARWM